MPPEGPVIWRGGGGGEGGGPRCALSKPTEAFAYRGGWSTGREADRAVGVSAYHVLTPLCVMANQ